MEDDATVVDLQKERVQVTVNGLKPLCFETEIELSSGEDMLVKLRYERLHGYCEVCFSLCHDSSHFLQSMEKNHDGHKVLIEEEEEDRKHLSYRGAVNSERGKCYGQERKLYGIFSRESSRRAKLQRGAEVQ